MTAKAYQATLRRDYLRNLLTNGATHVAQRLGASGAAVVAVDNTYQSADRWKTLQNAGTQWTIYTHSAVPAGSSSRSLLFNSNGNSSKGGAIQILENIDSLGVVGKSVSLQAQMMASGGGITDVRMAVLGWTGAVDTVTDPISAWNADGTNPTLAASWSYLNTPVNLNPGAYAIKKVENVPVGNYNNIAVMIWCEDSTQAAGSDSWAFTDVQLEPGPFCTPYQRVPFGLDYMRALRYYQKSYDLQTAPGTATAVGNLIGQAGKPVAASTADTFVLLMGNGSRLMVPMRTTPTVNIYSPSGAANAIRVGGVSDRTGATAGNPSQKQFFDYIAVSNVSATAIADRAQIQLQATADAEL